MGKELIMPDNRILIVDDEKSLAGALRELLTDSGYGIDVAEDGNQALNLIQGSEFQLVLLDLALPGRSGMEVMREIRRITPSTEIIIMTGHSSLDSAVEAIRQGAYDYLTKPFEDLHVVLNAVHRALEKHRLTTENLRLLQDLSAKNKQLKVTVDRLTCINQLSMVFYSTLEAPELLKLIIRTIRQQLQAERTSLMLFDKRTNELVIKVAEGIQEEVVRNTRVKLGEGVSGWVAKSGKPLLVEDIDADPRFQKHSDRPYQSDSFISAPVVLSVPLKAKGKVLGVVNVNNKTGGGSFTQQDLEFVSTLASQAAIAIENAKLFGRLQQRTIELKSANFDSIKALAEALETKDVYTRGHSDRTVEHAVNMAKRLRLPESEVGKISYAAILHDIGKIGIPEQVLNKPTKLSPEEYELMKTHPAKGAEIIKHVKFLAPVVPLVRHDHERWDGNGYPDGLKGEAIPLGSRIVAVVDAYDAMTTDRIYRKAPGKEYAISELKKYAGTQFDPKLVELFIEILKEDRATKQDHAIPEHYGTFRKEA